jgi:hypothetical protein
MTYATCKQMKCADHYIEWDERFIWFLISTKPTQYMSYVYSGYHAVCIISCLRKTS